jgi:DNA replication initiation complex subunit (GINS family)
VGPRRRLGRAALLALGLGLLPAAGLAQGEVALPKPVACTVEGMLEDVRTGLKEGSPAYRKYVRSRLKEAAKAMPPEALRAAVNQERDPAVLEVIGAALVTKASRDESPELIQPLLSRASQDSDPAVRAAAVKAMRATPSVEFMAKNGGVVSYEQLSRDASAEVRMAVAENLLAENKEVYFGHDKTVSETAISVAASTKDPAVAAKLLSEISLEQAGPEAVAKVTQQLRAEDAAQRAAAAKALGGVPGAQVEGVRGSLLELFRSDKDPAVRKAALEGLARLGQSGSRSLLESLRGVDPAMDPEIDAWLSAMKLNLQEWHLLLREKQRLRR